MKDYTAIEIINPKTFEIVKLIAPDFGGLEYDRVHLAFLVLNYPTEGTHSIVPPEYIGNTCDRIENGISIRLKHLLTD